MSRFAGNGTSKKRGWRWAQVLRQDKSATDDPAPLLGSWRRWYVLVIVNTLLIYLALWLFSVWAVRR